MMRIIAILCIFLCVDAHAELRWACAHTALDPANTVPAPGTMPIRLAAARGESESVQLIVGSDTDIDLAVILGDGLNGPGHLPTIRVRLVRRVAEWDDVLVPTQHVALGAGDQATFWITIDVPREAISGVYHGEVELRAGGELEKVPIELRVWSLTLPQRPSIPAIFGVVDRMFEDRYGLTLGDERTTAKMMQWYELLVSHRISPFFCRWIETGEHLCYTSPWPIDDPRSDVVLGDERLAAFLLPLATLTPPQTLLDDHVLSRHVERLLENGWFGRAFVYPFDEPVTMAAYERQRELAARLRAIHPGLRVLSTFFSGPRDGPSKDDKKDLFLVPQIAGPDVRILAMSSWTAGLPSTDFEGNVRQMREAMLPGQEWWSYVCMGPGAPQPNLQFANSPIQQRAVMWRVWKEQGTGFLYWAVNYDARQAGEPDAPVRFVDGLPPGDGVLVYPGEPWGVDGPLASIRLERWRDGMEDYEYLRAYEQRFGRTEAVGLLARIYQSPTSHTDDVKQIEGLRRRIAEDLLRQSARGIIPDAGD